MVKRAFSFLDMPSRSEKPRVDGITMCIDQGLGFDFVKGLLEMSSDYIDLWKLGWTTTQLQELKLVKKKISLLQFIAFSSNISMQWWNFTRTFRASR